MVGPYQSKDVWVRAEVGRAVARVCEDNRSKVEYTWALVGKSDQGRNLQGLDFHV